MRLFEWQESSVSGEPIERSVVLVLYGTLSTLLQFSSADQIWTDGGGSESQHTLILSAKASENKTSPPAQCWTQSDHQAYWEV
ncbi:Hypothetical predicted protein, partial [Pelobates cultripes]